HSRFMTLAWKERCGAVTMSAPSISSMCDGAEGGSRSRSSAVHPSGGGKNQSGSGSADIVGSFNGIDIVGRLTLDRSGSAEAESNRGLPGAAAESEKQRRFPRPGCRGGGGGAG